MKTADNFGSRIVADRANDGNFEAARFAENASHDVKRSNRHERNNPIGRSDARTALCLTGPNPKLGLKSVTGTLLNVIGGCIGSSDTPYPFRKLDPP